MNVSEQPVSGWKRFFMWDFPRGSVAYDIKVGAILAFIFLTPSWIFRDRPTLDKAKADLVMLPQENGSLADSPQSTSEDRFWLEGPLVESIPSNERVDRISDLLSDRTGKPRRVVRLEALQTTEGQTKGYLAVTRP